MSFELLKIVIHLKVAEIQDMINVNCFEKSVKQYHLKVSETVLTSVLKFQMLKQLGIT